MARLNKESNKDSTAINIEACLLLPCELPANDNLMHKYISIVSHNKLHKSLYPNHQTGHQKSSKLLTQSYTGCCAAIYIELSTSNNIQHSI